MRNRRFYDGIGNRLSQLIFLKPESKDIPKIFEIKTTVLFKLIMREGDVIVDAGANLGYFTQLFAKKAKTVVAIEPVEETMNCLVNNTKNYKNILYAQKALGKDDSFKKFFIHKIYSGWNSFYPSDFGYTKHIMIKTIRLDDLLKQLKIEKVDIIKIDVEGAEMEVFEGASKTLSNPDIKLIVEFNSVYKHAYKIINKLREFKFHLYIIEEDLREYDYTEKESKKLFGIVNLYCVRKPL